MDFNLVCAPDLEPLPLGPRLEGLRNVAPRMGVLAVVFLSCGLDSPPGSTDAGLHSHKVLLITLRLR